jgi:hypothetical protein
VPLPEKRDKESDMTIMMTELPLQARGELNHSCTSQCPNPCPAKVNRVDLPEITIPVTPEMLTQQ